MTANANNQMQFGRPGRFPRGLTHLGSYEFVPVGAERVRIRFSETAAGMTLTVHDPDVVLTAKKTARSTRSAALSGTRSSAARGPTRCVPGDVGLQRRFAVVHARFADPHVRLIARPNEVRSHENRVVHQLHLADDDEVGVQRVADGGDVAERPRGAQDGRVADHRQLRLRRQREDGRVGQRTAKAG